MRRSAVCNNRVLQPFSFACIISLSKADFQSLCVFDVEEGGCGVGGFPSLSS